MMFYRIEVDATGLDLSFERVQHISQYRTVLQRCQDAPRHVLDSQERDPHEGAVDLHADMEFVRNVLLIGRHRFDDESLEDAVDGIQHIARAG